VIKVLIVEDDIDIANLHRRFTEKVDGFEVVGIANGLDDAFEMTEILKPQLVLLDLYFPEGSGMDFLWKVRGSGIRTDIVLITAARDVEALQEAVRGGAFDYIVKPVVFDRFKKSLERFKEYLKEMDCCKTLEQGDIDHLLDRHSDAVMSQDMPKGIDPITLKKIIAVFESLKEAMGAEEVGRHIGASRNTARRYLEYLNGTGLLTVDIDYGTVGRPEKRFKLASRP
jgi:two-component system CitB family response regulator/two-component system response regulator DcuR